MAAGAQQHCSLTAPAIRHASPDVDMSLEFIVRAAAIAATSLAADCTHPARESPPVAGRYALAAVGDRPLPVLLDSSAHELGVLLADTIVLDGTGSAVRTVAVRRVGGSPAADMIARPRAEVAYRLGPGTTIVLGRFEPCPINALCIGNDTGTVRDGRMQLRSHWYGGAHRLTFVRIAD